MKCSRTWLQSYTTTPLPDIHHLADTLMLHAFEIEEVINDDVLDIDVLPNRAHDCLCHRGIAQELIGLLNIDFITDRYKEDTLVRNESAPSLHIENTHACRSYALMHVTGIVVKESPTWLQTYLSSIGQKSINNIVDATNYIMFDLGQPLHVFDADKVTGSITVRNAHAGETMTTLSGEMLELTEEDLVIADAQGVLALAGVKGGTKAEVSSETKNILIEVANFNPVTTRLSARRHKLHTDASKRFENEIHPDLVDEVVPHISVLIADLAGTEATRFSKVVLQRSYVSEPTVIIINTKVIESILGLHIPTEDILSICDRFSVQYRVQDADIHIMPHPYRLDLRTKEDFIEEIGRWYGYYNIPSKPITHVISQPHVHVLSYLAHRLRNILIDRGFSELYTYTFVSEGEIEVKNPIGKDKQALRTDLETKLMEAAQKNAHHASYFNAKRIAVFEIGKVYRTEGEDTRLAIALVHADKKADKQYGPITQQLEHLLAELSQELSLTPIDVQMGTSTLSFSLSKMSTALDISEYGNVFDQVSYDHDAQFSEISIYPHSSRDISVWVPHTVSEEIVANTMKRVAGPYAIKYFLFDTFTKDDRTSYAYTIVFQSSERTLADTDIDEAMQHIYDAFLKNNWEVR